MPAVRVRAGRGRRDTRWVRGGEFVAPSMPQMRLLTGTWSSAFKESISWSVGIPKLPLVSFSCLQNERAGGQQLSEATGTSLTERLKHLERLIRSSREEEVASELHLSALLDMVDIWAAHWEWEGLSRRFCFYSKIILFLMLDALLEMWLLIMQIKHWMSKEDTFHFQNDKLFPPV